MISDSFIPLEPFFRFLDTRKGKLDGVSICGGEPTMHRDLPDFVRKIKEHGFLVKLDTNGHNPEMVASLAKEGLVDYFAVDVKQTADRYATLCGERADASKVAETARIVMASGADYEFRTTVSKGEHSEADVEAIARSISGARRYFLQNFRHPGQGHMIDPHFHGHPFSRPELERLAGIARKYVKEVGIRE